MTFKRLLSAYERIADAPDAVPRLRRFILDLAMRGKLVPQDPIDESASELLKRISITPRKRATQRYTAPRRDFSGPFSAKAHHLPKNWAITSLGSIAEKLTDGSHSPPSNSGVGIPMLSSQNVLDDCIDFSCPSRFLSKRDFRVENARTDIKPGDVLLTIVGSIGRSAVVQITAPQFALQRSVAVIRTGVDPEYLSLFFRSAIARGFFEDQGKGTAQKGIYLGKLANLIVFVPPVREQADIVARIRELFAICDLLETARERREATRDRLTAASLARLNAPDPETFADDAHFALDALPSITARADQIKHLRQTILGLAVVGKLTGSESTGPLASAELEAVRVRKEQLELRKPKAIYRISPGEHWCGLPNRWVWARWDQITDWITYGFTRPMPHTQDGVPIITGKNVNQKKIIFETADRTPIASYQELNEKDRPKRGDILITKDGSIGRTAIIDTDEPFCINQSVAVLWLRSCHFDRRFLQLALDCPQTQQVLLAKTEGVAVKHISIIDLGKMVLPVPPLAEQRCIVAKVDDLMALCDQLEASLASADEIRRRLLDALLTDALAPANASVMEAAE